MEDQKARKEKKLSSEKSGLIAKVYDERKGDKHGGKEGII